MSTPLLRIATRGSPLALAQARAVRESLARVHGWEMRALDQLCPFVVVKTSGDRIHDKPLAEAGGKGLFVKEIEEALIDGVADIAVHSLKDMPAEQPKSLIIAAVLPREDPRDLFIARDGSPFQSLREGARLGSSSVRRQAQALRARPNLQVMTLRGNVETRLAKLARGEADATILAQAGLNRLNLTVEGGELLDWLPALCQGAIGIEIRGDDVRARDVVVPINNATSAAAIACERAFLAALDGSCRTPIAGLAKISGNRLSFEGEVLTLDGRNSWSALREVNFHSSDHAPLTAAGREAALEIREAAGDKLPRF